MDELMSARRGAGLSMVAGALVWAVHFMASYGAVTLVCTRGLAGVQWAGMGLVAWTMIAFTALALLVLVVIAWINGRRNGFVGRVAIGLAGLSALAIVWEAWLVTRGPPCT